MDELPVTLRSNDATVAELAAHGLAVRDAFEVFFGDPEFFRQPELGEISRSGVYRERPRRLRMVGPTGTGRMLTFILELPAADLSSHIVTGWDSSEAEVNAYDETQ